MNGSTVNVLVIDDDEVDRAIIRRRLRGSSSPVQVFEADGLNSGIEAATKNRMEVVLLDLSLAETSELETLRQFRRGIPNLPVIILTGAAQDDLAADAIKEGAQDFIEKSDLGNPWLFRCLRNAIQRHELQEQLNTQSLRDALTGLPNRVHLERSLDAAFINAETCGKSGFAVVFVDLDDFKLINDCFGHSEGDAVLVEFAQRLRMCVRPTDVVARFGGDEFVILLMNVRSENEITGFVHRLKQSLEFPVNRNGRELFLAASVGYTPYTVNYKDHKHMLRDADTAMYQAKKSGKCTHRRFSESMRSNAVETIGVRSRLRQALDNGEFHLVYQPIVDMETHVPIKFEALLRWHHPIEGQISPLDFIPPAERNGLIVPIGMWVIEESCEQILRWDREFPGSKLEMSVNVSPVQLLEPDFHERVRDILIAKGVAGNRLTFEITESTLMENANDAIPVLQAFREDGIRISIDDFGTGYSSLAHLHRLNFDCLKIDRSFVHELLTEGYADLLVKTILSLASSIGLEVIAEGIENAAEAQRLMSIGCRLGQGFLLGRPMSSSATMELLASQLQNSPV